MKERRARRNKGSIELIDSIQYKLYLLNVAACVFVGKLLIAINPSLPLDDAENYTYVRTVITVTENHKWLKEVGCHVSLPQLLKLS
jgi:hypothetical protein